MHAAAFVIEPDARPAVWLMVAIAAYTYSQPLKIPPFCCHFARALRHSHAASGLYRRRQHAPSAHGLQRFADGAMLISRWTTLKFIFQPPSCSFTVRERVSTPQIEKRHFGRRELATRASRHAHDIADDDYRLLGFSCIVNANFLIQAIEL